MTSSGAEPARRLVLDTSAYSRMRTGHEGVLDRIAAAEVVLIPVTVLGELEAAFELGSRVRENSVVLAEFLGEPFVSTLPPHPRSPGATASSSPLCDAPARRFRSTTSGWPPRRSTAAGTC